MTVPTHVGTAAAAAGAGVTSQANDTPEDGSRPSGLQGLHLPGPCLRALLRSHLNATDRLHIFQSSRTLAAAVLQHADGAHEVQPVDALLPAEKVAFQIAPDQAAPHMATYGVTLTLDAQLEQGLSQQQLQARHQALQGLLSTAPGAGLRVVLRHGITSVWARLPACQVTKLTLVKLNLPAGLEVMLPLQQCSKLRTLCLDRVGWNHQKGLKPATLSEQQREAFLAPALDHLEVYGGKAWGGLILWAQLLGKQFKHLRLMVREQRNCHFYLEEQAHAVQSPPATLSALTHFCTDFYITDQLLDELAALPSLTHVAANGMLLQKNHHSKKLQWQRLLPGRVLHGLHLVPLQLIQCIVFNSIMQIVLPEEADLLSQQLSEHPSVQCEPSKSDCSFALVGPYCAGLVSVCASRLTKPSVCLTLGVAAQITPGLPAAISSLPAQVTCLILESTSEGSTFSHEHQEQEKQAIQHIARALPPHVNRIWFMVPHSFYRGCWWLAAALSALATAERHVYVGVGAWPVSLLPQVQLRVIQEAAAQPLHSFAQWSKDSDLRTLVWLGGKCTSTCAALPAPQHLTQAPP